MAAYVKSINDYHVLNASVAIIYRENYGLQFTFILDKQNLPQLLFNTPL